MTKQHGGAGPAPFLTKTHQMVEETGTDEVISWGEKGLSFVVWKPVEFARDLLPAHFKHSNFSSFVRQLNTYGFRKVVPDRWEFANDSFRRGEEKLLYGIRRRKAIHTPTTPAAAKPNVVEPSTSNSGEVHSSSSTSSPPLSPQFQQLRELSDENEKLKNDNRTLTAELALAKKQYEDLRSLLSSKELNTNVKEELAIGEEAAAETAKQAENEEGNEVNCLKLFGVMLKGLGAAEKSDDQSKKRVRCEDESGSGRPIKMCYTAQWMATPPTAN